MSWTGPRAPAAGVIVADANGAATDGLNVAAVDVAETPERRLET